MARWCPDCGREKELHRIVKYAGVRRRQCAVIPAGVNEHEIPVFQPAHRVYDKRAAAASKIAKE